MNVMKTAKFSFFSRRSKFSGCFFELPFVWTNDGQFCNSAKRPTVAVVVYANISPESEGFSPPLQTVYLQISWRQNLNFKVSSYSCCELNKYGWDKQVNSGIAGVTYNLSILILTCKWSLLSLSWRIKVTRNKNFAFTGRLYFVLQKSISSRK